jgi:hypothetical protein
MKADKIRITEQRVRQRLANCVGSATELKDWHQLLVCNGEDESAILAERPIKSFLGVAFTTGRFVSIDEKEKSPAGCCCEALRDL